MKRIYFLLFFCYTLYGTAQTPSSETTPDNRQRETPELPVLPLPETPDLLPPDELDYYTEMPSYSFEKPVYFPKNPSWPMQRATLYIMANDSAAHQYMEILEKIAGINFNTTFFRNLKGTHLRHVYLLYPYTPPELYLVPTYSRLVSPAGGVGIGFTGTLDIVELIKEHKKKVRAERTRRIIRELNRLPEKPAFHEIKNPE